MGKKEKISTIETNQILFEFSKIRKMITTVVLWLSFLDFSLIAAGLAYLDLDGQLYGIIFHGAVAFFLLITALWIVRKSANVAAVLLNLIAGVALFLSVWLFLGKDTGFHYFFITLALLPWVTLDRRYRLAQWLFSIVYTAVFAYLLNVELTKAIAQQLPEIILTVSNYGVIAVNLLFLSIVFSVYNRLIENIERDLKSKNEELLLMQSELKQMAVTDEATGAVSNRKMEELIRTEIARSDRYETPFSLIIFSLSDIREVFAVYGQEKGEQIMEQLVTMVRGDLRLVDVLGRWSDGEFVVFMPEIKLYQAVYVAQRLLSIIAVKEFFPKIKLPANFAVLQRLPQETYDDLVTRMKKSMEKSRKEGENRIIS